MDPLALTPDARDLVARLRRGELVAAPRSHGGGGTHDHSDRRTDPVGPPPVEPSSLDRPRRAGWRATLADRLPVAVRGALLDPAARGAVLLGLVALLAALVAVGLAWRAAPRPVALSAPAGPAVTGAGPGTTAPTSSPPPMATQPSPAGRLVVDVAGKVHRPGVVTLPAGARVADALARAGGVLPGTDTSALSLARKLTDGEQVLVTGKPGAAPAPAAAGSAPDAGGATAPTADPSTPLDLNAATVEQFDGLPGVGPVLAGRIVEYRTAHGGFTSVDQLREVKGLGGKTGTELLPLVRVG